MRLDERAAELRRNEEAGLPDMAIAQVDVAKGGEEAAREEHRRAASLPSAAPFEDPAYDHAIEVEVQDRVADARPSSPPFEDPAYDLAIEIMRRELLPPSPVRGSPPPHGRERALSRARTLTRREGGEEGGRGGVSAWALACARVFVQPRGHVVLSREHRVQVGFAQTRGCSSLF